MFGKYLGFITKTIFVVLAFSLLFSCVNNDIDKLLREADTFINKKNHTELFEQFSSIDNTINIKAMAEVARFMIVIDELEKQRINMSVKQLEKYLLLTVDAINLVGTYNTRTGIQQTVITDPSSPYVGRRPEYSFFDGIGRITTKTRDFPNTHTVTVEMIIGYDLNDQNANNELLNRQTELNDFVRRYFSGKTADELAPEKEEQMKAELREMLNTRFFDTARARIILFNRLDVMEDF